jgi:hypothetical protein
MDASSSAVGDQQTPGVTFHTNHCPMFHGKFFGPPNRDIVTRKSAVRHSGTAGEVGEVILPVALGEVLTAGRRVARSNGAIGRLGSWVAIGTNVAEGRGRVGAAAGVVVPAGRVAICALAVRAAGPWLALAATAAITTTRTTRNRAISCLRRDPAVGWPSVLSCRSAGSLFPPTMVSIGPIGAGS